MPSTPQSNQESTEIPTQPKFKMSCLSIILIAISALIGIPIIVMMNAPYQVTCERRSSFGDSNSQTTMTQGFFDRESADAMYNQRSASGMTCSKDYSK